MADRRTFAENMILVRHHVVPSADNPEKEQIGGAYVVSYVNHTDAVIAAQMAKDEIDEKWVIQDFEGAKSVEREQYEACDSSLQYFDQALLDTVVSVFHTYPVNEIEESNAN